MDIKVKFDSSAFTQSPARLAKNIRFATAVALTRTAGTIRLAEIAEMKSVFDRPTPWTLNSLAVKPATKTNLVALVRKKEFGANSAGHILGPHIDSGQRGMRRAEQALGGFVVPGRGMKLDRYGNLAPATYVKILSQLKLSSDSNANASNSSRSKAKRRNEAYFMLSDKKGLGKRVGKRIVFQRKGQNIMPALLILKQPPKYGARFPYFRKGEKVFDTVFPFEFDRAIEQAFSDAGWK